MPPLTRTPSRNRQRTAQDTGVYRTRTSPDRRIGARPSQPVSPSRDRRLGASRTPTSRDRRLGASRTPTSRAGRVAATNRGVGNQATQQGTSASDRQYGTAFDRVERNYPDLPPGYSFDPNTGRVGRDLWKGQPAISPHELGNLNSDVRRAREAHYGPGGGPGGGGGRFGGGGGGGGQQGAVPFGGSSRRLPSAGDFADQGRLLEQATFQRGMNRLNPSFERAQRSTLPGLDQPGLQAGDGRLRA